MDNVLVSMEGIDKRFPGVQALSEVDFEVTSGEVHALVGENGAGKTTLMKILTGVFEKDEGQIYYKGEEVEIDKPVQAQELGINIIYQEFNLMPHLTIAQNTFIGREPRKGNSVFLDEKEINRKTEELLDQIGLNIDPRTPVMNLTVAEQQMVEIIKALSYNSEVLIMDEPTAALTDSEIEELFRVIDRLRKQGVGVVYISHRLEEIKEISDRVTVLRNGNYIDTVFTEEVEIDDIIQMMVGRTVYETSSENEVEKKDREVILKVKNLTRNGVFEDVNFELNKGEILGLAGLVGAGRTEVARAIFGADPIDGGEIYFKGNKVKIDSPKDAINTGIGYLSEDRKRFGLVQGMEVGTNIVMASFSRFLGLLGFVKQKKINRQARELVDKLDIKTPGVDRIVKYLSGGNQQKVVIAKWLLRNSEILIFDEPTRGIDVGAKSEIYQLLNELVENGKSIIMISSELSEILRMSHRVAVMCEGRLTGTISGSEANKENIMQYATAYRT